jgi:hypothetical protein
MPTIKIGGVLMLAIATVRFDRVARRLSSSLNPAGSQAVNRPDWANPTRREANGFPNSPA